MTYDQDDARQLVMVHDEALRTARNLQSSVRRVGATLIPLDADRMDALGEEDGERLDAFRIRCIELQDLLGSKVFRALITLEQERPGSQLDTLHAMERRGVIASVARWIEWRRMRNRLAHDYPATAAERAAALNEAFSRVSELFLALDAVRHYCAARLALELTELGTP